MLIYCKKRGRAWLFVFAFTLSLTVTAFAADRGFFGNTDGGSFGGGPTSSWSLVSYETLSQLSIDIVTDSNYLSIWQIIGFQSAGTAQLKLVSDFWVIEVINNGTTYWFCNNAGYPYYATDNGSFSDVLESIDSHLFYIDQAVHDIPDLISTIKNDIKSLLSTCTTISDNLLSVLKSVDNMTVSVTGTISTCVSDSSGYLKTISEFITGEELADLLTDVSEINTGVEAITTFNNSLKTHILAIKNNSNTHTTHLESISTNAAAMLTQMNLLTDLSAKLDIISENTANITIDGGTIESVTMDTSALEEKLDTVNTTLTDNLIYNNRTAAAWLYNLSYELFGNGNSFANRTFRAVSTQLSTGSNTLVSNVSAMLTNQENILTDLDSLNQVLESLGNIEGDFSALPNDIYSFITEPIENFEQRVMNSLESNDGYLEGISNNLLDLRDAVSDMTDAVSDMNDTAIENVTNITINEDNDAYEIFYITDESGERESIADLSGDVLTVGGKLLNFFFKVAFDGAINSVDTTIEDMTGFYLDDAVVLEGSLWE